jgi:dihydropteroate synthase
VNGNSGDAMKFIKSPDLPRGFSLNPDIYDLVLLRPLGLLSGAEAVDAVATGLARWLAGGPLAFTAAKLYFRAEDAVHTCIAPIGDIEAWSEKEGPVAVAAVTGALSGLSPARDPFAGVALDRPRIFGIVNVTPDSFHDGGRSGDLASAIEHGRALSAAGADIIDIGGESTRPGSSATSEDEELRRVMPVVEALVADGAVVSIDTRRPVVMNKALGAGARIVNDINALRAPGAVAAVAEHGASAILMHMQGSPETMQSAPHYDDAPYQVCRFLGDRVRECEDADIPRARLAVDPGIGFGKTDAHNLALLDSLAMLQQFGCAVMLGISQKSIIGRLTGKAGADDRLPGTLAATVLAAGQGVQFHRVHDAAEAGQALAMWQGIAGGEQGR